MKTVWLYETKKLNRRNIKNNKKILDGFRRKKKTATIFFDIKKAYDKIDREKTIELLENIEIPGRRMKLIRELISAR